MSFQKFDRSKIRTLPLSERENKIYIKKSFDLGRAPVKYDCDELSELCVRILEAKNKGKPVVLMMGAHVIRRGNSAFIIDLINRGIVTHIAVNGAFVIHDFELSYLGATCEDVEYYIKDGRFGNWEETGRLINEAVSFGYRNGLGYGRSVGKMIFEKTKDWKRSVVVSAYLKNIPVTVHKSIGQDITDQHSCADYEDLGGASGRDFLIFAETISKMEDGGVFLNLGTQVMGPEVYLKALSMARNVAHQKGNKISNFTTAVFDIVDLGDWQAEGFTDCYNKKNLVSPRYYFRPHKTILIRTIKDGGKSFYVQGDFAVTVPNFYKKLIERF